MIELIDDSFYESDNNFRLIKSESSNLLKKFNLMDDEKEEF